MYAQCPDCLTVYKLRAEPLALGRGRARCGSCGAEFDALATLVDELPAEAFTTLKRRGTGTQVPQLNVPALRPQAEQRELFVDFDRSGRASAREHSPSFAHVPRRASRPPREWRWPMGVALLTLLLGGQFAWAQRERLLQRPGIRLAADSVCARLGCSVPTLADRARISLTARDIRPHPSVQHALIISATLLNRADFAQSYPTVEITLSDVDENRIALRRFSPQEYLSDPRDARAAIGPGASATFNLEVEDPGKDAVAFEFRFL
jgi:predicted Zn finger-like uncharacterized protein